MIKPPCKNCADRKPGCHGQCEGYLEYKNKNDRARQKERDMRHLEHPDMWCSYAPYQPMHKEKPFLDKSIDEE